MLSEPELNSERESSKLFHGMVNSAHNQAGRLQVRSALNPMLWLTAIVLPLGIVGAWLLNDNHVALYTFLGICGLPVATSCVAYIGLAVRKPDKLQSEDFQI